MYWDKPGKQMTEKTIKIAIERGIHDELPLIIPSRTGETVFKALEYDTTRALQIICVTHMVGYKSPWEDEMDKATRKRLAELGVPVLTTTHVLAGVDRGLRFKFGGVYPPEIIANTLRMFGEGIKVCVEIGIMALDAGLIPYEQKVIAVGGSGSGADAAAIITPAHSTEIFDIKVHEILAKPQQW